MSLPLLDATQVGVGATVVDLAAWAVLVGGIIATALWIKALSA
jgi:hypothetical protein